MVCVPEQSVGFANKPGLRSLSRDERKNGVKIGLAGQCLNYARYTHQLAILASTSY
jgi:hypothetical protein